MHIGFCSSRSEILHQMLAIIEEFNATAYLDLLLHGYADYQELIHGLTDTALDVLIYDMDGDSEAEAQILRIKQTAPNCQLVLLSNSEKHALFGYGIHAAGYLLKPISAADVQDEINSILGIRQREKPLKVKCFGNFEVYVGGEKLSFKRSKTKELLAFLVDRNGAGVTAAEIGVALWENDEEQKNQNYIHQLFYDLRHTLDAAGVREVFKRNNYLYSVDPDKLDCDYYTFLKTGKPDFYGEYMTQYSWAEKTCGLLWNA